MFSLDLVKVLRPHQWIKNGFVFMPLFFSGNLLNGRAWYECLIAFVGFSLAASAVYCLNDIQDVEADRLHPKKRLRPIASGRITPGQAVILLICSILAALCVVYFGLLGNIWPVVIIGLYFVLNVAYCLKLKQYAIVDVFVISVGFVLRLFAGGTAARIWVSPWLVCLTFLLALFLAFAKRRDDVVIMEETGIVTRNNIRKYNSSFLNQTLSIVASITMMCYIMYTVNPEVEARLNCEYVYLTAIFVLAGILRYLQVALVDMRSGSPTKVLMRDRFIQASILGWLATFLIIIYL